jgi:cell division protein FtsB
LPGVVRRVTSHGVSLRLVDMHVGPAKRRWIVRFALALVVAVAIGYVPAELVRRDPRALKLAAALDRIDAETRELAAGNAALMRDITGLREDVSAIEARARADLGMVYPDEVVMRIDQASGLRPQASGAGSATHPEGIE